MLVGAALYMLALLARVLIPRAKAANLVWQIFLSEEPSNPDLLSKNFH